MSELTKGGAVTLLKAAEAEIIEKKSRFIGHATPVKNEAEAQAFVAEMKAKYSDATHNVYAYHLNGGAIARCSDDGEPQGSSGYPTLNALATCGATDLCVVVTRYFGGTLLGTAGLARTYAAAARAAIEAAGFAVYKDFSIMLVEVGYSEYQKLESALENKGIVPEDVEFGADVILTLPVPEHHVEWLNAYVSDITRGRGAAEVISVESRLFPLEDKK